MRVCILLLVCVALSSVELWFVSTSGDDDDDDDDDDDEREGLLAW